MARQSKNPFNFLDQGGAKKSVSRRPSMKAIPGADTTMNLATRPKTGKADPYKSRTKSGTNYSEANFKQALKEARKVR